MVMVSELAVITKVMMNLLGTVDDCDFDSNNDKKAFQRQRTPARVRAEL